MERILKLSCFQMSCCRRTKTPERLVKDLKEAFTKLNEGGEEASAKESLTKCFKIMEDMMSWHDDIPPNQEIVHELAYELCDTDVFYLMVKNLSQVDFESSKIIMTAYKIFIELPLVVEYINSRPDVLYTLIDGYGIPEVSLKYGYMLLRTSYKESFTRTILYSKKFFEMFTYIDSHIFHVSTDALKSLSSLLLKHKDLCSDFLIDNYDNIFSTYNELLKSENACVCWALLKLLSRILRAPEYRSVMFKYTEVPENLKQILALLRSRSRHIQYEAFNVFAVFAVCPHKSNEVLKLLLKYKPKLLKFLENFQEDRDDDNAKFCREKSFVIDTINDLEIPS